MEGRRESNLYSVTMISKKKKKCCFISEYHSDVYLMWLNRHRLPYITLSETENAYSHELYFILWIQLSISYSESLPLKRTQQEQTDGLITLKTDMISIKLKKPNLCK